MDRSTGVASLVRHADLFVLALALPVFLALGLPMLGYGALAGVWVAQHLIEVRVEREAARRLAQRERRAAMGWVAATTLGRVWTVALVILLVGQAQREAGLAAAVLAAVLVTFSLGGRFLSRMLRGEELSA